MTARCVVCGGEFEATRADARYCKPACRQKAMRERSAENGHDEQGFTELPDAEQERLRASIRAFVDQELERQEVKRAHAGLKPMSEAQRDYRERITLRNLALQARKIPVPSTGTFGKGAPGSGNSIVPFDPATGEPRPPSRPAA